MTELERYQATVRHEIPDRLLYQLSFTPDLARRVRAAEGLPEDADLALHFGSYRPLSTTLKRPAGYPLPDWSRYFEGVERPPGSRIDANGCLHLPCQTYHFTHRISPLRHARTFGDLQSYPWPEWDRYEKAHLAREVRRAHAEGRVARVNCTHMYEDAWQVRGYEEFLVDMLEQPEWAHFILERFKERNLRVAIAAAEAGADELHTGDDVANQGRLMFSRDCWRRFIKERWAEVYAAAKRIHPGIRIWYHSDGNISEIIPELLEIGVDLLNPLQPECMDLYEIKRRHGARMVCDGTIGTQTTMPFGTPEEVRATVRERIERLGADGALILGPTHVLEPEVPLENIRAFVEACKEFGAVGLAAR